MRKPETDPTDAGEYLTASEIERIEADDVLEVTDVLNWRTEE